MLFVLYTSTEVVFRSGYVDGCVICKSFRSAFLLCKVDPLNVICVVDLNEEEFNHENENVGGDYIALLDSLLEADFLHQVTTEQYVGFPISEEKVDPFPDVFPKAECY